MFHEKNRITDLVIREQDPAFGRDDVTLVQGTNYLMGQVIGRRLFSVPDTGTASAGNTGFGTVDDVSIGHLAMYGLYTISCVEAEAGSGKFIVTTPEGVRLPDAVVGTPFVSPHINFTINDGDPDFVIGDSFTVEIGPGEGKATPINFAATDGTQIAYGFTIDDYDATEGDIPGVVIKEKTLIKASGLVWPEGITAEQKADALAVLASRSILDREGA